MMAIISALGRNRAIGIEGKLPWHLPDDLRRFKRITMGHPVVMGRKTYASLGRPLPGRTNLIVTRNPAFRADGCLVLHRLDEALRAAGDQPGGDLIFVIGGGEIYRQALPLADRLYLTLVDDEPADADTFFPEYDRLFLEQSRENHPDAHPPYAFVDLVRRG